MFRKLLLLALVPLLAAQVAHAAGDMTDEEILAFAGPKTCEFGQFPDQAPRALAIPIIPLDPNITYEYCFRLPRLRKKDIPSKTSGFVELFTTNISNGTCGTASVYVIRPDRKPLGAPRATTPRAYAAIDTVQHNIIMRYTPGVWRVLIRGESGFEDNCTRYRVDVGW
jgi:hypothetical protein